jgi:DNA (cytosine-5)-methyltransferase 1
VGTPDIRDAERLQGFPTDWTKPAESMGRASVRWKLVGNAVSVRASEWIGKRLAKPGKIGDFIVMPLKSEGSWPTAAWNIGDGRMHVAASEWPVRHKYQSLENFLLHPLVPLSAKATAGFLGRAERGGLRFPPSFLNTLRTHLAQVQDTKQRVARAA